MKTKPIQSQFKANLLNAQMNVNKVLTKHYENVRLHRRGKNKPNQTQFHPHRRPETTPKICIFSKSRIFPVPNYQRYDFPEVRRSLRTEPAAGVRR